MLKGFMSYIYKVQFILTEKCVLPVMKATKEVLFFVVGSQHAVVSM